MTLAGQLKDGHFGFTQPRYTRALVVIVSFIGEEEGRRLSANRQLLNAGPNRDAIDRYATIAAVNDLTARSER
jgi:hypothetical protein